MNWSNLRFGSWLTKISSQPKSPLSRFIFLREMTPHWIQCGVIISNLGFGIVDFDWYILEWKKIESMLSTNQIRTIFGSSLSHINEDELTQIIDILTRLAEIEYQSFLVKKNAAPTIEGSDISIPKTNI